ncbi:MAG: TolC family protein [Balneolales bacterium]
MKKKISLIALFTICLFSQARAHDVLSIEDAIILGMENNFNIQIAQNQAEISSLNKSFGNAGFLPSLEISGIRSDSYEDNLIIDNGVSTGTQRSDIMNRSAAINMNWTIFDGMRMFSNYNRLSELENLNHTEASIEVERIITDIVISYYNIVRQQKSLGVLETAVETSEERVQIAETKRELGSGSEYELLLAQTDLNADQAAVIRQEVVLNDAKMEIIRLLDLEAHADFEIVQEINLLEQISLDEAFTGAVQNNHQIEAANTRTSVSKLEVQETRRARYPEIDLNIGYTMNRNKTDAARLLVEEIDGPAIGFTARFNLFDGFNINSQIQIAKINHRNNQIELDEQLKSIETRVSSEFKNYTSTRRLVELEQENLELAEQTLEIALERFTFATITSIELRESQRILIDTENRLITSQYEAKISETELLRLSGNLLEEFGF